MADREREQSRGWHGVQRRPRLAVALAVLVAGAAMIVGVGSRAARALHAGAISRAEPTTVSLRLRDVPAPAAYAELARAGGVQFHYDWAGPPEDRRVTLSLLNEPLWLALDRLNAQARMDVSWVRRAPRREVGVVPRAVLRDRQVVAGCVDGLFGATLYDRTSDADQRAPVDPTKRVATKLGVVVRAEPKLQTMMFHSIKVDELIDDAGRAIDCTLGSHAAAFQDGVASSLLVLAERPWPRRIGRLRMSGTVLAAAGSETAEITGLAHGAPAEVTAAGFRIETAAGNGPRGRRLTLKLTRVTADGPDWLRPASRLLLLRPVVLDAAGRRWNVTTLDQTIVGRTAQLQLELHAPPPRAGEPPTGDPHTLLLEIPTEAAEYDVRIEFADVKLF